MSFIPAGRSKSADPQYLSCLRLSGRGREKGVRCEEKTRQTREKSNANRKADLNHGDNLRHGHNTGGTLHRTVTADMAAGREIFACCSARVCKIQSGAFQRPLPRAATRRPPRRHPEAPRPPPPPPPISSTTPAPLRTCTSSARESSQCSSRGPSYSSTRLVQM